MATDSASADQLAAIDKASTWHPFTQMKRWCDPEFDPVIFERGEKSWLWDTRGRKYLDGNSSIWTNLHGHNHPRINEAILRQMHSVAHVSYLGAANVPATLLAEQLTALLPGRPLERVFFSDNGSTAVEVALKMAIQYWQLVGRLGRNRFVAFSNAYHGDTAGAASLGGIGTFFGRFAGLHFPVDHIGSLEEIHDLPAWQKGEVAGVVVEPLIQGAAGMRVWPSGMLQALRRLCDETGTLLILDEVMTGFGRTGTLFACQQEAVVPDFLCLAKGLTGGYLPLAATLTHARIFEAFLGEVEELKTLYYGHSYTANPLACAAALANLEIFAEENTLVRIGQMREVFRAGLSELEKLPSVHSVRQCGLIAGIDLVNPTSGLPYSWEQLTGARVCRKAADYELWTRPILDTVVLMPPYCFTDEELRQTFAALRRAIEDVCVG